MKIRIENQVSYIPSIDDMRLLGASTSRGDANRIGQFGSGFVYSLALLARYDLLDSLKITLGKDVYTFGTKSTSGHDEIVMKKQNGGTYPLNVSTDFGGVDWRDVTHAVREFISNAIDGAQSAGLPPSSIKVEFVEDNQDRAKDGTVRVYLDVTPQIEDYILNRHKYFLCLKPSYDPSATMIPAQDGENVRVYRRGVLVKELRKPGLFHYNFPNIHVNECRVADTWTCDWHIEQAWKTARASEAQVLLTAMLESRACYELGLNLEHMAPDEDAQPQWKQAADKVLPGSVITDHPVIADRVKNRGVVAKVVDAKTYGLLSKAGVKTASDVLSVDECEGRVVEDAKPLDDLQIVLNVVWSDLERGGFTKGKPKPSLKLFVEEMQLESQTHGFYRPGGDSIYVNRILQGMSLLAFQVVLEEVGHYLTGAADCTRDFQDWSFGVAAFMMKHPQS